MSDGRDEPGKRRAGEQTETVTDPATVDGTLNIDPANFRIGSREMFLQATEQTRMALCISDPTLPDCPIVYVNEAFVKLTGYPREEIVGRNCRFLQGDGTDTEAVARLREAIAGREFTVVDLLNYRKDGSSFWNAVHVGPIFDENGELAYFYGSQWDITELVSEREKAIAQERVSQELRHRTDNLFSVINAMVRMSARSEDDVAEFADKVTERISALATAHRVSIPATPDEDGADLQTLVEKVLQPYRNRYAERIDIGGDPVVLAPRAVTALGLAFHELATNALKYGALSVSEGRVSVHWRVESERVVIDWEETCGPAVRWNADQPAEGTGSGTMLMQGMLQSLGGTMETDRAAEGYHAHIELPVGEVARPAESAGREAL